MRECEKKEWIKLEIESEAGYQGNGRYSLNRWMNECVNIITNEWIKLEMEGKVGYERNHWLTGVRMSKTLSEYR